jgi:hypothetical protein
VQEQQSLKDRGIETQYAVDPTTYKATTLTYSGQFPDFGDIEAVYARSGFAQGDQYTVTSLLTKAKSDDLRQSQMSAVPAAIMDEYRQLPETVTPRTRELAHQIADAQPTAYDKAKAIETYLRQNITYTEDVDIPPANMDVVDYVLFESRKGYCEYYASAFIVMARELGLPARMVTGFFPADRDAAAGGFLYRELNAHAWPEVYFPGFGWVPFEPTAQRAEISRDPVQPAPSAGPISPESGGEGNFLPDDSQFFDRQQDISDRSGATGAITKQDKPITRTEWALRGGFLALMLGTILVAYLWLRGMRGLTPTGQLYAKVVRGAKWGGIQQSPAMTPHEYASVLAKDVPGSRAPATYLADLYVRETYSKRAIAQSEMLRARQAWLRLRGLLVKRFFTHLRPWGDNAPESDEERW